MQARDCRDSHPKESCHLVLQSGKGRKVLEEREEEWQEGDGGGAMQAGLLEFWEFASV